MDIVVFREICMKHASQSQFGRPMTAVRSTPAPDKWTLLKDLTAGAEEFGLTHRSLNVLRALMTFLPGTEITDDPAASTVFPANRTLSARLNGMPESTLRRHLAHLVSAGIVSRTDSPNRKRYARRISGDVTLAFGFDLSPLAQLAPRIAIAAHDATARRHQALALRDRVAVLRQALQSQDNPAPEPLLEEVRLILRRKPDMQVLRQTIERLEQYLPPVENTADRAKLPSELSGTTGQNERHIQDSDKTDFDSEGAGQGAAAAPTVTPSPTVGNAKKAERAQVTLSMGEVLGACTELRTLFPQLPRDWPSLLALADRIAPMLGIDRPVLIEAQRSMGSDAAALAVICMLERPAKVRSPGAYLRRLSQKATVGRFSILPMVKALVASRNAGNCQLTTC